MTRADILARIADRIHFIVGAAPNTLAEMAPAPARSEGPA